MYLRFLSLILFCLFSLSNTIGQNVQILGEIKHQDTKKGVDFASVTLLNSAGKPINMTKTQNGGKFTLPNVAAGSYSLKINSIGFQSKEIKDIIVKDNTVYLKTIFISENKQVVSDVIISANKSTKASNIEKKEYSPSQLLNAQNASAAEVIGNIPSLNMGGEGNSLSFRGDDNITVLINGKISSMTGENLSQIPASAIEKIEVISNPTAKTNSEGSAGVVNIVLKKAYSQLNSGFVAVSAGSREKYNAQLGYNFQMGKFSLSTAYNYRYEERYVDGYAIRSYDNNGLKNYFNQSTDGMTYKPNHFFRLGAEYQINANQSIAFTGSIAKSWENRYETKYNEILNELKLKNDVWDRKGWENDENLVFDATLSYNLKNPTSGNTLSIEYSINGNNNDKFADYSNVYNKQNFASSAQIDRNTIENLQTRITNIVQADFRMPYSKLLDLETGLRGSNREFRFTNLYKTLENNEWITTTSLTNDFRFSENVFSLYGVVSSQWSNRLSSKMGLRMEQTNTKSTNFDSVSLYNYNYFNAFPSAIFNYKLNEKSNLSASYALRINRPGPGMLNPLQDVGDPQSQRFGNPELKPELVHSFEVAMGSELNKKLSFNSSIYHKRSQNAITRFLTADSTGVTRVYIDNIGNIFYNGWEFILNYKPNKIVNFLFNSNLSYNILRYQNGNNLYENSYWNLQTRGVMNVKLPWDMDFQAIGFYKSPMNTPQGQVQFVSNVDLTLRKKVFNQKGLLTLGVTDLLDDTKFEIEVADAGFTSDFRRKRETRVITLGFRYNFGKDPSNTKKNPKLEKPEPKENQLEGM
jgi:outer membrane receptor protein involved in Fe transport